MDLQHQIQDAEHRLTQLTSKARNSKPSVLRALEEVHPVYPVWEVLTAREQVPLIQMLVAKVGYDGQTGKATVDFRSAETDDPREKGGTAKE
jgi:hypothetical protein